MALSLDLCPGRCSMISLEVWPPGIMTCSQESSAQTSAAFRQLHRAVHDTAGASCLCPHTPAGIKLPSYPDHTVCVRYATEHRCGVAVRGPGLSDAVGDTDPLKDKLHLKRAVALDDSQEV